MLFQSSVFNYLHHVRQGGDGSSHRLLKFRMLRFMLEFMLKVCASCSVPLLCLGHGDVECHIALARPSMLCSVWRAYCIEVKNYPFVSHRQSLSLI
jgi:hypothetical protein